MYVDYSVGLDMFNLDIVLHDRRTKIYLDFALKYRKFIKQAGTELGKAQLQLKLGYTLIEVCCITLMITNYHYTIDHLIFVKLACIPNFSFLCQLEVTFPGVGGLRLIIGLSQFN